MAGASSGLFEVCGLAPRRCSSPQQDPFRFLRY